MPFLLFRVPFFSEAQTSFLFPLVSSSPDRAAPFFSPSRFFPRDLVILRPLTSQLFLTIGMDSGDRSSTGAKICSSRPVFHPPSRRSVFRHWDGRVFLESPFFPSLSREDPAFHILLFSDKTSIYFRLSPLPLPLIPPLGDASPLFSPSFFFWVLSHFESGSSGFGSPGFPLVGGPSVALIGAFSPPYSLASPSLFCGNRCERSPHLNQSRSPPI